MMHLERVTFKDNPVHVVNAGGTGVLLRNSGNTDVYVFAYGGVRDDFYIDDPTPGLRIGVGETITLPVKQGNNRYPARTNVFAATDELGGPSAAPAADSPART